MENRDREREKHAFSRSSSSVLGRGLAREPPAACVSPTANSNAHGCSRRALRGRVWVVCCVRPWSRWPWHGREKRAPCLQPLASKFAVQISVIIIIRHLNHRPSPCVGVGREKRRRLGGCVYLSRSAPRPTVLSVVPARAISQAECLFQYVESVELRSTEVERCRSRFADTLRCAPQRLFPGVLARRYLYSRCAQYRNIEYGSLEWGRTNVRAMDGLHACAG